MEDKVWARAPAVAAAADEAGWVDRALVDQGANAFALFVDSQPLICPVHRACRVNAHNAALPWRGDNLLASEGF